MCQYASERIYEMIIPIFIQFLFVPSAIQVGQLQRQVNTQTIPVSVINEEEDELGDGQQEIEEGTDDVDYVGSSADEDAAMDIVERTTQSTG